MKLHFFATREIWYRIYPYAELNASLTVPFTIIARVIILTAAEINYRCIENPPRKVGRRISDKYFAKHNALASIHLCLQPSKLTWRRKFSHSIVTK